jgi:hypothetical protein
VCRDFITLLGGGAAMSSLPVQAQQPTVPTIGYLSAAADVERSSLTAFGYIF